MVKARTQGLYSSVWTPTTINLKQCSAGVCSAVIRTLLRVRKISMNSVSTINALLLTQDIETGIRVPGSVSFVFGHSNLRAILLELNGPRLTIEHGKWRVTPQALMMAYSS